MVTTDFVTPVVDDARTWGRIAAQNAVSDVYAMGGRPLFALNLVAWPRDELPLTLLGEVLAGGADIGAESGFVIVGGHSVDDPEPKYGLAVVGEVAPDAILTNTGLRDGDALVLTKALGIGVATTAIKRGEASEALLAAAVASMTAGNGPAARLRSRREPRAPRTSPGSGCSGTWPGWRRLLAWTPRSTSPRSPSPLVSASWPGRAWCLAARGGTSTG